MNTKILLTSIILGTTVCNTMAFDLDMTVDDDIRKNYNSSQLVKDTHTENSAEKLPALPDITKYEQNNPKNEHTSNNELEPIIENNYIESKTTYQPFKGNTKIHSGTSFDVINYTKVNDWLAKGNTIKFYTKNPIIKRKYTIPANTIFYGEIIETHRPRISGNGGLVVIRIHKMLYKGHSIPINAYVTRADDKKIFLNNIKGERNYLKTVWKKGNWGRSIFNRMMTLTINLGGEGSTLLLSPFPFTYGTICLGLNTLTSPICAFFNKGGHVSIPSGSNFRIKLLDDIYVD